jgi:type IV pilus assembly protein PilM
MALPFLNGSQRKLGSLIGVDLGGRTTKAVELQRHGGTVSVVRYAVQDVPPLENGFTTEALSEHLRAIWQALDTRTKSVSVALGVTESLVRQVDLPQMPVNHMRQVLKNNSKNYLQQDLSGHAFDCFITAPQVSSKADDKSKPGGVPKMRVLVGGAKQDLMNQVSAAVKAAGLSAEAIVPGLVGPVNAFELAMPEIFSREAVALIDFGFRGTSICLLQEGELILSRVVPIGGDHLTSAITESMGVSYAEAESIKVGLTSEVQANLEPLLTELGRELRASIDCFEHQQDKTVSQAFITGGSARSEFMLKHLQNEIMLECKPWSPLATLKMELPANQAGDLDYASPQLAVAVGAVATIF